MKTANSHHRTTRLVVVVALIVLVCLVTSVSFAYNNDEAPEVGVVAANRAGPLKYGHAPAWSPVLGVPGGVDTPGDLYLIDATGVSGRTLVHVYLANAMELSRGYSYIHLKLGVYRATGTNDWLPYHAPGTDADETKYITILHGPSNFLLEGGKLYRIPIDGGSYYAAPGADAATRSLSPSFFAEASS